MSITSNKSQHAFGFGRPATYRIVIQGVLSAEWSDRLAGLSIATTDPEIGPPQTTLEGRIHDQAELNGVLTTLYGLHLPLLSVEKLQEETSVTRAGGNAKITEAPIFSSRVISTPPTSARRVSTFVMLLCFGIGPRNLEGRGDLVDANGSFKGRLWEERSSSGNR